MPLGSVCRARGVCPSEANVRAHCEERDLQYDEHAGDPDAISQFTHHETFCDELVHSRRERTSFLFDAEEVVLPVL